MQTKMNYYKNIYLTKEPFILEIKDSKIKSELLLNNFTPYSNALRLLNKITWFKLWINFFIKKEFSFNSIKVFIRQIYPSL